MVMGSKPTGSKNRILDWMRAGLPALAGELAEITHFFA